MKNLQKILIAAVIVLVIINGSLVAIVWNGHQQLHQQDTPRPELNIDRQARALNRRLELKPAQETAFKAAMQAHHQSMRKIEQQQRLVRKGLQEAVFAADQKKIDSLSEAAQKLSSQQTKSMIQLAASLGDQLNADQKQELMELFNRMPRPGRQAGPRPERPHRDSLR